MKAIVVRNTMKHESLFYLNLSPSYGCFYTQCKSCKTTIIINFCIVVNQLEYKNKYNLRTNQDKNVIQISYYSL